MILYFSGTGNTRYCAQVLSQMLGDEVVEMEESMLLNPSQCTINTEDKRIITMFPTYSWGIPPVVVDVLKEVRFDVPRDATIWMVTTCGDDVGLIARQWRKIILGRGLAAGASFSVQMPNTYVCMKGFDVDTQSVELQKLQNAEARLQQISDWIANGMPCADDVVTGGFAWVKSKVIRPWFEAHCMKPEKFTVSDACVACGLCVRSCPMGNIAPDEAGRPVWHDRCAFCLRCYHICPQHAVGYDGKTSGKGQYNTLIRYGHSHSV